MLELTEQAEEREKCSWTIQANFCNRNDAKVAVVRRVRSLQSASSSALIHAHACTRTNSRRRRMAANEGGNGSSEGNRKVCYSIRQYLVKYDNGME